jgi:hypothetical protein
VVKIIIFDNNLFENVNNQKSFSRFTGTLI